MPFPQTPANLRKRQAEPLSHQRLLNICYAYKRLREHVTTIQRQINEALDGFQHSTGSRNALTEMIASLASIDGGIGIALHEDILNVELELVRWETKASKLRSEARRQQQRRAERREGRIPSQPYLASANAPGDAGEASDAGDWRDNPDNPNEAPAISPTMQLALKGMKHLPTELPDELPGFGQAPDTSGYKKSGLV